MAKRVTESRCWRAAHLAPAALALALGACSATGDSGLLVFADPGKYQYYNCKQIEGARASVAARHKELGELIGRAEQETGGALVGAIAYRSDYAASGQDLKVIDATAREKNCPLPAAPQQRRSDGAVQ
jgi:hypothetical protein